MQILMQEMQDVIKHKAYEFLHFSAQENEINGHNTFALMLKRQLINKCN